MKKMFLTVFFGIFAVIATVLPLSSVNALDTVVVGQPYYPYYGGYYGGGYGPYYGGGYSPYFGGAGYYNPNPVFQGQVIGGNPYFLGIQSAINRGTTTRQEVRNAFQKSGTIFLTPNAVNVGNYGYYGGYFY